MGWATLGIRSAQRRNALLSQGLCSLQNKIGKKKTNKKPDVFSEVFVILFLKEAVVFLFLK